MSKKMSKPWSGRFQEGTHPEVERFTKSLHFDRRLFPFDIQGSIAHAHMLESTGLISHEEAETLMRGLGEIREELEQGRFPFDDAFEDIHMNIEARLIQKVGAVGGKLHTGRSRNDQVALDMRLYLRQELREILAMLHQFLKAIVSAARQHLGVIMPGYTHLQRAQPVLFSHHLLAYFEMGTRDKERLEECLHRVQVMPLGAGALSGTSLPIDREFVARELGFERLTENSLDAVSDRDYILEFLAAAAIIMMHLSRFAEEMILWSGAEFRFIELPDALCTGSSIMPQKKNPDPLELVRGKTGRVYGHLMGLLTTMKALPLSYNRDLQEDKEPLFDTIDTLKGSLSVMTLCVEGMKVLEERMKGAVGAGFLEATDLAEYLVGKGVPFREAHHIVGRIVGEAVRRGWTSLASFPLDELREFCGEFDADALPCLDPLLAAARKDVPGGTSLRRVEEALERAEDYLGRK